MAAAVIVSLIREISPRAGSHADGCRAQRTAWTSRAEYSDLMLLLARTTPKEQVQNRADGLSVFIVDMREAKSRWHDHQADPHDD